MFETLELNGVEKTFDDWNIVKGSVQGRKAVGGADTFQLTLAKRTIADELENPTFPFESKIVVRVGRAFDGANFTGGTIKFVGYSTTPAAKAAGRKQSVTYRFEGPWYHLRNCDYLQAFKGDPDNIFSPEIILFTSTAGVASGWIQISVGDQLQAILQWLLDQYEEQGMDAPFQYTGRTLNEGEIDLSQNATAGTPGGDFGFDGHQYNQALPGAGLTIDETLFSLFLPTFIEKPMKCSAALTKCLELSPRVNVWFDYNTVDGDGDPLPTIRFDLVDDMPGVTLPLFTGNVPGGPCHKELSITPWQELSPRAVIIKYRITNSEDGRSTVSYAIDKWSPSGSRVNLDGTGDNATDPNCGLRVINELIDLQGFTRNTLQGFLDVEPFLAIGTTKQVKRNWWASKRGGELPQLEDTRVRFQNANATDEEILFGADATDIPDATVINAATGAVMSTGDLIAAGLRDKAGNLVLNRHVSGAFHSWMRRADGQAVVSLKVKVSAKMTFTEYDCTSTASNIHPTYLADIDKTGNVTQFHNSSDQHVELQLTNAAPDVGDSGLASFSTLASGQSSESYIIGAGGIAHYLYDHLNALQYVGDHIMVAAEFVNSDHAQYVTLGKKLNLTGGAAAWATMNAQILGIEEDYATHETSIEIGVGHILQAKQLSDLFNMWRNRRAWYNPSLRVDNEAGAGGDIEMAKASGGANTVSALKDAGKQTVTHYSTPPTGSTPGVVAAKINNDPTAITKALAATTPTPTAGFTADDLKEQKPREIAFCDEDGNTVYAVGAFTGFYTKP